MLIADHGRHAAPYPLCAPKFMNRSHMKLPSALEFLLVFQASDEALEEIAILCQCVEFIKGYLTSHLPQSR